MPDSYVLAVANTNACAMDFFDTATGERIACLRDLVLQPHEIWPDHQRRLIYVVSTYRSGGYGSPYKSHEVSVVSMDSHEVVDVIDISPFIAPHDIEYCPARNLIYAGVERSDGDDNGLVVIDPEQR